MLRTICESKTRLSSAEIAQLEEIAAQLPLFAEITGADLFIDCLLSETEAVVVAQARPTSAYSSYEKMIVGESALLENEPALFHAASISAPVRDIKAVTQENRSVSQNVVPIRNPQGDVIALLIQETDISSKILQEKKLEALSKSYEQEDRSLRCEHVDSSEITTLREVNHRIKNSLQLVASILNMEARKHRGTEAERILTQNVGRILSISAIHDILNTNQNSVQKVSSLSLLGKLGMRLQELTPEERQIKIVVTGDDILLSAGEASSVALVVNELITNALEHAFQGRNRGKISVSFCKGTLFHTVTVCDDGIGFPADAPREGRLGLRIVESTVRDKLRGKLSIHSDANGTRISFDIKNEII